jgi:hypothetical protein
MQINPNINMVPSVNVASTRSSAQRPRTESDGQFSASDSLATSLQQTPDSRPAEVERASALAGTGSYPASELIKCLSRLLAGELSAAGK